MKTKTLLTSYLLWVMMFSDPLYACTDFRVKAKDGSIMITRTLEFAEDLKSNLRTALKGVDFKTPLSEGKQGLSWKSKYGYVFLDGLNMPVVVDGMNEKGLSFEYLYLPGETQYQTLSPGQENKAISYYYLGDWVLGNFSTIEEVKDALKNIIVIENKIPGMGNTTFPLHASIYDATGKGIVVEFIKGKMIIHDNEIGILTNSPTYDWQVTNLRNYINLSPYNPNPVIVDGITFNATGQGAGMMGLPGDVSPPSRFVKMAVLLKNATPVNTALEGLNLSEHIINTVDIPLGLVRTKQGNKEILESTQWVVFKDLTHKIFYYRTYNDMTIRAVFLDKLNLSEKGTSLIMPISGEPYIKDVTEKFTKSTVQKAN